MGEDVGPCLNLRTKSMFYRDPSEKPSEHELEVERLFGKCDTATWWCQLTQTGRGPDDQPVNQAGCSCVERKCYFGLAQIK
jgi:hypothetical protein